MSPSFRTAHANLANLLEGIILAAAGGRGRPKWELLADEAAYVTARADRKSIIVMALVCKADLTLPVFSGHRHVYSAEDFYNFVVEVDASSSCLR